MSLVVTGAPPLVVTHMPMAEVPDGTVNAHGHVHKWVPGGTRHINVVVEHVRYRPRPLTAIRQLARCLARGERVPGRTTAQQLTHAGEGAPTS